MFFQQAQYALYFHEVIIQFLVRLRVEGIGKSWENPFYLFYLRFCVVYFFSAIYSSFCMLSIQVAAGHYFTIQTFNNLKAKVDLPVREGGGGFSFG